MLFENRASSTSLHPPSDMFGPLVSVSRHLESDDARMPDLDPEKRRHLDTIATYCRDYLSKSDPRQGRAGPVCPYTHRSFTRELLRLTYCRSTGSDEDALADAITGLRSVFVQQDADIPERDRLFHSIVMTFPNVPDDESASLIDRLHRRLKPEFTALGLMLGEFYPSCDVPGLHNPDFRPLRTPVPVLVIRHMTIKDAPFLLATPGFRADYKRHFGEEGARYMQAIVERIPNPRPARILRIEPTGSSVHAA